MLLSPVSSGCIQYLYNYSLYTIHLVLCILYSIYTFTHCISLILYSVFCTVFIHLFIVYHLSCTVYSVLYYTFIYSCIPFILYSVFCILFIHLFIVVFHSSCTVYSVQYLYIYSLYSIHLVQCILYSIYTYIHCCIPFIEYSIFCMVFIHLFIVFH